MLDLMADIQLSLVTLVDTLSFENVLSVLSLNVGVKESEVQDCKMANKAIPSIAFFINKLNFSPI
ncbi:hypothetical protein BWK59_13305 [Flavobacterium davisii]|uniref:Uncharacterized protein n=1 Tax=Flavobacterium davisii TaxID=2906077 RepID=A0A246GFI5_9FLAO|nr:hypothetical protein BWK59_13305 [Flavobacterium davisii]